MANLRFEEMQHLLESSRYFKLVCGAGNEDAEEVRRLTIVYTLAGANGFDVSATPRVVEACSAGIRRAYELAPRLGIEIPNKPFITVSVGMPGDHHVRKAKIVVDKCVECNLCIPACPTDAIPASLKIIPELCIGCGHCEAACPPRIAAIAYDHNPKTLDEILPACRDAGAENIELHAAVPDDDTILQEWRQIARLNPDNYISMCLDRFHLSNFKLLERIRSAREIAGDRLIIQADGVPMSGGCDDHNTTLQAIAIADVINKEFRDPKKKKAKRPFHILLSGGTNGKTAELAALCNVEYSGLSIGTHARKIVKDGLRAENFDTGPETIRPLVDVAADLVRRQLDCRPAVMQ